MFDSSADISNISTKSDCLNDSRFFAFKGTREAELRNSFYIYNPPKPSFDKEGLWQVCHLLICDSTSYFPYTIIYLSTFLRPLRQ